MTKRWLLKIFASLIAEEVERQVTEKVERLTVLYLDEVITPKVRAVVEYELRKPSEWQRLSEEERAERRARRPRFRRDRT